MSDTSALPAQPVMTCSGDPHAPVIFACLNRIGYDRTVEASSPLHFKKVSPRQDDGTHTMTFVVGLRRSRFIAIKVTVDRDGDITINMQQECSRWADIEIGEHMSFDELREIRAAMIPADQL